MSDMDIFLKMNDDKCYKRGYPKLERVFDSDDLHRLDNKDCEDAFRAEKENLRGKFKSKGNAQKRGRDEGVWWRVYSGKLGEGVGTQDSLIQPQGAAIIDQL